MMPHKKGVVVILKEYFDIFRHILSAFLQSDDVMRASLPLSVLQAVKCVPILGLEEQAAG